MSLDSRYVLYKDFEARYDIKPGDMIVVKDS